jgi:hypothetical protein
VRPCRSCGKQVEGEFRFCPWCASPLRRKLVEFFEPHERDHDRALRVSWYLDDDPQVRFSVWDENGRALAAVSLQEAEAERLGSLLTRRARSRPRSLADRLARALRLPA